MVDTVAHFDWQRNFSTNQRTVALRQLRLSDVVKQTELRDVALQTLQLLRTMSQKRKLADAEVSSTEAGAEAIFRSGSIEDRDSTFVTIFSPTVSSKDLQKRPEFKSAMHRMVAWRKASTQQTLGGKGRPVLITGSDDDGEKYGGKRLEKVLTELDVEGSVVCARWYVVLVHFLRYHPSSHSRSPR